MLKETGELVQRAFKANGSGVAVVAESNRDPAKSCIYLGDTKFARANGVAIDRFEGWTYAHKVVGKDVIIAGRDVPNPAQTAGEKTRRGQPIRGARMATVKGVADFLRKHARTRFLYPNGETGIEFLDTPVISVPADLDIEFEPRLRFNSARTYGHYGATPPLVASRDLYAIANNYFPVTDLVFKAHSYNRAIPVEQYAKTNPEYFGLIGKKRTVQVEHLDRKCHYCISGPQV